MKNFSTLFLFICLLCLNSCEDTKMPYNDGHAVEKNNILGRWKVEKTNGVLSSTILEDWATEKLCEILNQKALNNQMEFTSEYKGYRYDKDNILRDSCNYRLSKDTIFFDNPQFIGFYAEYLYLKNDSTDSNHLVAYLKTKEILTLLEHDSGIDDLSMSLIRTNIKDTQGELFLTKQ